MPKTSIRLHLRKCLKNRFLKKPSIFHIKNFVPTNTYKFLKNDRNVLNIKKNIVKFTLNFDPKLNLNLKKN
jgi:hypothetical protein